MPFQVFIDDNFHHADESERSEAGAYATYEEAEAAARAIVEQSVRREYKPGMTSAELWEHYTSFGEDPFIRPEPEGVHFNGWDFAREVSERVAAENGRGTS
ncbi:MAG: hypothetical protein M3Z05_06200 [Gemmatimonadota bacterium]|nr:hypothetical protein [Gemmatimonadota bacterium]